MCVGVSFRPFISSLLWTSPSGSSMAASSSPCPDRDSQHNPRVPAPRGTRSRDEASDILTFDDGVKLELPFSAPAASWHRSD
ncbi:hypothetical protein TIFTF001_033326 [Ficus carica]|uniref:Uncharacterized protein n=1 Tax=Ficus carica TaxID=3494 RepID=A0AA88DY18_FICCA|nr:hypothetical protein TIFTF001_033325 [Ficus carica]GMN64262.1 hypothetical protein TIFTF001_033326 [Ficus carica]